MKTANDRPLWVDHEDLRAQETAQGSEMAPQGTIDGISTESEIVLDGVSRRTFLGVMGASAAFAGVGLQGCVRKPVTKIVPYRSRPEDLVPGRAEYYASVIQEGLSVTGLLVESHEGRPTKIEGNPNHPESGGSTTAMVQGSVLGLYDLDRSVHALGPPPATEDGQRATLTWEAAWAAFDAFVAEASQASLAVVTGPVLSPTQRRVFKLIKAAIPSASFFNADVFHGESAFEAARIIAGPNGYALPNYEHADVVAAFDCDFLGREHSANRATRGFSAKRRISAPGDAMNRLYAVESNFSITGASADHRLRARGADIGALLVSLAAELVKGGAVLATSEVPAVKASPDDKAGKFVSSLAKDLLANKKAALVVVGHRQPAWVHGLAFAINDALGAVGGADKAPLTFYRDADFLQQQGLPALAEAITKGTIKHVLVLDANPAHTSGGALDLRKLLNAVHTVHCGIHADETSSVAKLHIPVSHYLEAWSDCATLRGVAAIAQPLVEPLHHTPSTLEVASRVAFPGGSDMHQLVRDTWKGSEAEWQTWLHDGLVPASAFPNAAAETTELDFGALGPLFASAAAVDVGSLEVSFYTDSFRLDGRYANNAWLQESPDPMTKLCWDNAALVSRTTAKTLGEVKNGTMVNVTVGAASVSLPVYVMPGLADGVVALILGHGRKQGGLVAGKHGFDVYPVLPADAWFTAGTLALGDGFVPLANVQPFGNTQSPVWGAPGEVNDFGMAPSIKGSAEVPATIGYRPRSIVFEATRDEYKASPDFTDVILDKTMKGDLVKSHMYPENTFDYFNGVHQWGMSIDLNTCTGCNACMVACQAENNISVVGKEQVLKGREMSWIRLDRYFIGDADDPQAVLQPLNCQHCETAPCEAVCPVKATAHTNEGLNDMAYNRCIGTRYCSNNCPYKVRRFNFFNYNIDIHPLIQMQKNPDVTIRFRGVIEKCTYCVQRISAAKIEAKIHGDGRVRDGGIITACQQVCPAEAIVFGDIKDENSLVSKRKNEPRDYSILRELNTRPRTTYLAKIRNPNPDLV